MTGCLVTVSLLAATIAVGGRAESAPADSTVRVQAEGATVRSVGGPDGPGWNLWSNGHVAETVRFGDGQRHRIVVRARGNSSAKLGPSMELRIDGERVGSARVHVSRDWRYRDYAFDVTAKPGLHEVAVAHTGDPNRVGRNVDLVVDWFAVAAVPAGPETGPPQPLPAPTSTTTTTSVAPPPTTAGPLPTTAGPPTTSAPGGSGRSPHVPAGYRMTWNDEFDSLSLDLDANGGENWGTYFTGWNVLSLAGNGDQCMKADPSYGGTGTRPLGIETHRVQNGVLSLFGRPIPADRRAQFWNYQAVCGMITGQNSHAQTYGYWETRMRISNVSTGHHWAIWLLPENNDWPPEVDIVEVVGLDPSKFHFTGHFNDSSGNKKAASAYRNAPGGADDWYTLGLEWTANSVVWYLDGVEVHRMNNFIGTTPNYFLISPEVGGNWPGPTSGATRWPMSMDVDYVRIYSNDR